MPEGDTLHRAARSLQALVGERLEVETPHPRAAAERIAERLDGRRLVEVQAVGKNVLLRFEGGLVLRSHLRMSGTWRVVRRGTPRRGRPWLVLRGAEQEAVLWRGPVLELHTRALHRLGPDILAEPPEIDQMMRNLRGEPSSREIGDALLDQRVVAGIGNMWKAEALWRSRISPWDTIGSLRDEDLRQVLEHAAQLMVASVETGRETRSIYGRTGRRCPRCGTPIRARGQGDANRTAYWCPHCQRARPTTLNH
jgi:endonuclease-8